SLGGNAYHKADQKNSLRVVVREKRNMSERTHVALRKRRRRRHPMSVGEEGSAGAWRVRDGNDLGEAFAQGEQPLAPRWTCERPRDQVIGRQQQPQSDAAAGDED